jgi:hypothetical protein
MELQRRITALALAGLIGYLALYLYGLVTGVFSPGELAGFTVIAGVAAIVFGVHAIRVRRAIKELGSPAHEEIARASHVHRERRGY